MLKSQGTSIEIRYSNAPVFFENNTHQLKFNSQLRLHIYNLIVLGIDLKIYVFMCIFIFNFNFAAETMKNGWTYACFVVYSNYVQLLRMNSSTSVKCTTVRAMLDYLNLWQTNTDTYMNKLP